MSFTHQGSQRDNGKVFLSSSFYEGIGNSNQITGYKSTVVSISVIDELEMKAGATHEENTL